MLEITITFKTYKHLIQNNLKLFEKKTPHYNVNKFYNRIPEEIKKFKN